MLLLVELRLVGEATWVDGATYRPMAIPDATRINPHNTRMRIRVTF